MAVGYNGNYHIVSLPYTNVEYIEVTIRSVTQMQFWFIPNKPQNQRNKSQKEQLPHIDVYPSSPAEKREIKEFFYQGKLRNIDDFQPSSISSSSPSKLECDRSVDHLVENHLPFLWTHKRSFTSLHNPWTKVFVWGLCIVLFLIGIGPGVMLIVGMNAFSIWLPSVIIVVCWLVLVFIVMFTTRSHFAISEKGLLKIKTGLKGTRVQSLPFDKVFPVYSKQMKPSKSNTKLDPSSNKAHSFQSLDSDFVMDGPNIIAREEFIFRKYLDTLKGVAPL